MRILIAQVVIANSMGSKTDPKIGKVAYKIPSFINEEKCNITKLPDKSKLGATESYDEDESWFNSIYTG